MTKTTASTAFKTAAIALVLVGLVAPSAEAGPSRKNSALKKRLAALGQLDQARTSALTLIRDEVRYADADKGRSSQDEVTEHAASVAKLWKVVEANLVSDLKKLHRKSKRAQLDALVSAAPSRLNDWEKALLKHFRDLQTLKANHEFVKAMPKAERLSRDQVEQIEVTNAYRMSMGLPALTICTKLTGAAGGHTSEMVRLGYFSHTSPNAQGATPFARAMNAGFDGNMVGENIAMGYASAEKVHGGWITSPGHHRNILTADWECMGVARVGDHWTQMFGRVSPAS